MKNNEHQKLANNPIYFSNKQTEALEEALALLMEAFEEYAAKNEFTEEKIALYRKLILETYAENRASHFIQDRFAKVNEFLNKSLFFAMKGSIDSDNLDLFYYSKNRKLITNESY
jgi:hypothetical protein